MPEMSVLAVASMLAPLSTPASKAEAMIAKITLKRRRQSTHISSTLRTTGFVSIFEPWFVNLLVIIAEF